MDCKDNAINLACHMQAEIAVKVSKLQKEKDFLQQTSESLLRNQDDFRTQLTAEQANVKAKDAQITDLTEQVSSSCSYRPHSVHCLQHRGNELHSPVSQSQVSQRFWTSAALYDVFGVAAGRLLDPTKLISLSLCASACAVPVNITHVHVAP